MTFFLGGGIETWFDSSDLYFTIMILVPGHLLTWSAMNLNLLQSFSVMLGGKVCKNYYRNDHNIRVLSKILKCRIRQT